MESDQVEVHFSLVTSVVCQLFLCVAVVQLGVLFYLIYSNPVRKLNCRHSCSICLWKERNLNWSRKLDECYVEDEVDYRVIFFFHSLVLFSITYLSPCTKCEPHLKHEKHFKWNTKCCMFWLLLLLLLLILFAVPFWLLIFDDVRITNSLAGIVSPHAEHAPELPNSLQRWKM